MFTCQLYHIAFDGLSHFGPYSYRSLIVSADFNFSIRSFWPNFFVSFRHNFINAER